VRYQSYKVKRYAAAMKQAMNILCPLLTGTAAISLRRCCCAAACGQLCPAEYFYVVLLLLLQSWSDLATDLVRKVPSKIDIGPVYTHDPRQRAKYAKGEHSAAAGAGGLHVQSMPRCQQWL
jgi:hypothetical protein